MFSWVEVVFARILTTTNGKPISMAINALFGFQTDIGLVMAVTVASMIPGAVLVFSMRHHLSRGFKVGKV
jgi:glycerol transport system permease protein